MKFIISLIITYLMITQSVMGQGSDYTDRNSIVHACKLFAEEAYQASENFSQGVELQDVLSLVEGALIADSIKNRMFQAIQFVWKNQLNNPVMAYSLAMGLCLKPKKYMAPMDDPGFISFRTSREYF